MFDGPAAEVGGIFEVFERFEFQLMGEEFFSGCFDLFFVVIVCPVFFRAWSSVNFVFLLVAARFVFIRSDRTEPWTGLQNSLLLFNASNSKASFPSPVAFLYNLE